ncbi:MAG: OmpA family protein [Parvularculaceae bacterium]
MKKIIAISALAMVAACTTTDPYTGEQKTSKATKGAIYGAIGGAVVGAATNKDKALENAIYGAAAGAAIGGGIGAYMDRQEQALRAELEASGVSIRRVGDQIELVMPSNITFASNQSDIKPEFYQTLNGVGKVLAKYDQTTLVIGGHTDASGSDDYNMDLSIKRAENVGNYLASQGVVSPRIRALGYGESQPVADNTSDSGKSQNRRVQILIDPPAEGSMQ